MAQASNHNRGLALFKLLTLGTVLASPAISAPLNAIDQTLCDDGTVTVGCQDTNRGSEPEVIAAPLNPSFIEKQSFPATQQAQSASAQSTRAGMGRAIFHRRSTARI